MTNISVGDIVEATITSIKDFGAFADFGEGSGLIYYTQIVPKVEHGNISSVLSIGEQVKCKVEQIKPDGKISLTMKLSASIEKKPTRSQIIENVKEDIKDMSSNDTSIRAIWKALTEIQHYMLKYMQGIIPFKKGSVRFDRAGNKLTAEIDTSVHFDTFKKEVRRIFDANVIKHESLKDYWYFDTDVELHTQYERDSFTESSGHMYVVVHSNPVLEITIVITDSNVKAKDIIIERLQSYYPQIEILSDNANSLYIALPYRNRSELKDLKQEIVYAMSGIQNGIQDEEDNSTSSENTKYDAVTFNYSIRDINDSCDRFLVTMNPEALMDQEGLRFGSFRGQNFMVPIHGKEIPLGVLNKIEYPKATFKLKQESQNTIRKLVEENAITSVTPDVEDMTGEIEKINRLRDSFDRITEHPEALPNPKLSSYLFDATKATPLDENIINERIELIKKVQLNTNLNPSQVNAIAKAVEAEDLALIQGPPGTGKSTAIAELIWQLAIKDSSTKYFSRQKQTWL